jgi:hypothetical protein
VSNILLATELPELGRIGILQGNALAAIESKDTAAFYTGSQLVATEPLDQASFIIPFRPVNLATVESLDRARIDILTGILIELAAVDPKDIGATTGRSQIKLVLSAIEQLDQPSFHGLSGIIGSLSAIESGDTGLITFSPNINLSLAGTESLDSAFLHIKEVPITFLRKAVVMHLFNYAVTEYKNYNFNSLLHVNGVFIGINEEGIYLLDGNDDLGEPIQARIKSGLEDFAAKGAITVPREAWLSYRSDNAMQLDVKTDEVMDLPSMIFAKVATAITECRAKLGRGIKSRFFTWDLKNIGGSDFSLESLRILGDIMKRKTR